ncbi:MAG: porin, partial [Cyanobacteriota bacterium]|nr:porin [Cyanobacteriota bacterium]
TYSLNLGAGVGLMYQKNGFNFSWNYVANEATAENSAFGIGQVYTTTAQLGYSTDNAGVALAYTYGDGLTGLGLYSHGVGLSGYWSPSENKAIPSISAGVGWNDFETIGDAWSWMVGMQWEDAFMKGNALGMAIGSAGTVDGIPTGGLIPSNPGGAVGGTLAYELWYKFQVTDNISVTPAFFAIGNGPTPGFANSGQTTLGGLVKTTFKF